MALGSAKGRANKDSGGLPGLHPCTGHWIRSGGVGPTMLCKRWMLGLEIEADNIKEIGIAKE